MRIICIVVLYLTFAAFMLVPVAQEDTQVEPVLGINYTIDDPLPCTREQASKMYETLDGFQGQIKGLDLVTDLDSLADWFAESNAWVEKNWVWSYSDSCDGNDYLVRALNAHERYRILERMFGVFTGFGIDAMFVSPRADALDEARAMAEVDLAAMEESDDPDIELALNSAVNDLPRCTPERAMQFYETIDGFEGSVAKLLDVDSWDALFSWAFDFHLWRTAAWEEFYEQPCGVTVMHIYAVENKTYLAALMQGAGLEDEAAEEITQLIQDWRGYAEYDLEVIEAATDD